MGLKWYKNVKSLFLKDHVTAFNSLKQAKIFTKPTSYNCPKIPILDQNKYRTAIPLPSERFKAENIQKN